MFHASKKARRPALWLMAAAVIPLSMLVLSLSPAEESASALYIVSNDGGVVDLEEPEAQVFLTDAGAELVSRQGSSDPVPDRRYAGHHRSGGPGRADDHGLSGGDSDPAPLPYGD